MTEIKQQIPKFEELENITRGQKVIIGNEGVMRFKGTKINTNQETGELWDDPVFLAEINDNGNAFYKKVTIKMREENALELTIIKEGDEDYRIVQRLWRSYSE